VKNSVNSPDFKPNGPKYLAFRQRQVFDLLSLFQASQLVGLFGENGTGKTSLIQHGLISELKRDFLGIAGRKWKTTTIRPGISPLENLAAGLTELMDSDSKLKLEDEFVLTQKMKSANDGLRRASIQYLNRKNGYNHLLVIDNFEDLFHLHEKHNRNVNSDWVNDITSFIQNISKCASHSDVPLYFLIILRSDFVPHIFEYRNFHDLLSKSQYTIPQFRRSDFQEVVLSMMSPSALSINKEAIDLLYLQFGKDLKNLKLLELCIEKAIKIANEKEWVEITTELLLTIEFGCLYEEKLESFYTLCTLKEKKLTEKIFKQITLSQENSNQRQPINIGKLLKVVGVEFNELNPFLQKLRSELDFTLEIIVPYQERLNTEDLSYVSENALINVKNEHFVSHWPRLIEWIRQEKESQEIYKRLSESAIMFDQDLTGFLRPPDLDFILNWYEDQKPDELWANQFDGNFKKTIGYLLESKKKFQEEIIQKENIQKQKIKQVRKTGLYGVMATLIILIVISVFAYGAKKQESLANIAREKAEKEKERARMEKERADLLYNEAQNAMQAAQTNEKLAVLEKRRADDEFVKADFLRKEAEGQKLQIQKAFQELDVKSAELGMTIAELQVSDSLKGVATRASESARAYQEALNSILSLRNKIQKGDFQKEDFASLMEDVKSSYDSYISASKAFKGLILPNNDLYQILMEVRRNLVQPGTKIGQANNLMSLPNGLRKISLSSSGILATGGDDGILLYSKKSLGNEPLEFKTIKIPNDRIRSLEFLNASDLVIGTVKGTLYRYYSLSERLELINLGGSVNQVIEQIIYTNGSLFALKGGEIFKIDLKSENRVTKITEMKAARIFKFKAGKLLIAGQNLDLLVLDINTLQWKSIDSDLKKKAISTVITSGEKIFFGMENGDVHVSQITSFGNETKITTRYIIPAHLSRITSLNYDSETQKLFTASLDQKANIFDLSLITLGESYITNHLIKIEGFNKWIWDFEMVKEGKERNLLTVDENGDLKLWQTGTEMLYNELFQNDGISINPKGK
jgi:WD40 repeat protein